MFEAEVQEQALRLSSIWSQPNGICRTGHHLQVAEIKGSTNSRVENPEGCLSHPPFARDLTCFVPDRLQQQIEEGTIAGRELAHRLNNDLTMPVGVVELLLDRGLPGSDLQEMLEAASKDLAALEQHVRAFHEQMRDQSSGPAGPRPTES